MRPARIFTAAATLILVTAGIGPATAIAGTESAVCGSLVRGFPLPGAATHVTSATVVAATAGSPEYCDVHGYVEPAVRVELRLPTKTDAGR